MRESRPPHIRECFTDGGCTGTFGGSSTVVKLEMDVGSTKIFVRSTNDLPIAAGHEGVKRCRTRRSVGRSSYCGDCDILLYR